MSGESTGVDYEWTESLADLAEQVAMEAARWREQFPALRIVWRLDEEAMTAAAEREGVELPR